MTVFLRRIIRWWNSRRYYVIADPSDSSLTLSRALFAHMRRNAKGDGAKVLVFSIPESRTFGFMLNPDVDGRTALAAIQYNARCRCVGFETLCPTVALMLWTYGVRAGAAARLSV